MNTTLRNVLAGLGGLLVIGGTFVAAAAIGDASQDEPVAATVEAVPSTPAAAPATPTADAEPAAAADPTWPATAALAPIDQPAEERGAPVGPDRTGDPGMVEPIDSAAPADGGTSTTEGSTSSTTAPTAAAGGGTSADSTEGLAALGLIDDLPDLPWFRFLDPCADGEDGSCGLGIGGTILPTGDDLGVDALKLGRTFLTSITSMELAEICGEPLGTQPDGRTNVLFFTNNPATLHVTWWPLDHPDQSHDLAPIAATDAQRDEWLAKVLAGTPPPNADAYGVPYCIQFPAAMTPGQTFQVRVQGTDDADTSADATYTYLPGPIPGSTPARPTGRPPLVFSPMDSQHGVVGVLVDNDAHEQVWMADLPRNGDSATGASCTSIENEVLSGHHRDTFNLLNERTAPMFIPGPFWSYDPRFDTVVSQEYWPGEGAAGTVCVWVTTAASASFDKPVVQYRSSVDVAAPRWYRTKVAVTEAHLDTAVGDQAVEANVVESGFGGTASRDVVPAGTAAGAVPLDEPLVIADSGGSLHPNDVTIRVTSAYGETTTVVPTPNEVCPITPPAGASCPLSTSRTVTVRIPGPTVGRGLCGSSFGDCDPPHEDTFLGDLVLTVTSYAGPAGPPTYGQGFAPWSSTVGTFTAADPDAPPAAVQVDANHTSAVSGSGTGTGHPSVTLTVTTDRPTRLTAYSDQWDNTGNTCGLPPRTDDALSVRHTVSWDSMACFGTSYVLEGDLTDAAGRVTHAGPGGEISIFDVVTVTQMRVGSVTLDLTVHPKQGVDWLSLDYAVDGITWPLVTRHAGDGDCTDSDAHIATTQRLEGGYPIDLAEPLYLGVTGYAASGDDCRSYDSIDASAYVNLSDATHGPVHVQFEDDLVTVDATVSVVRPLGPLPPRPTR